MKKLTSYAFEYSDGSLEIHVDATKWANPRKCLLVDGIYHLGTPTTDFWVNARHCLGVSEDYCVIPVNEERFNELTLEAMLNE